MAFCEQCGVELAPGAKFCEECGAEVPIAGFVSGKSSVRGMSPLEVFVGDGWRGKWQSFAESATGGELGIIVTRESALISQIGMDADVFHDLLSEYIESAARRSVSYAYLDLQGFSCTDGSRDADSVVAALREVVDVTRPKYLFILGNEEVVDVVRWENQARDSDKDVPSDLCYSTLDMASPWQGQKYDFDAAIRVGRLPTYPGETEDSFSAYFVNAAAHGTGMDTVVPYGLSARVWEAESNHEYGSVSAGCVDVSPEITKNCVAERIEDAVNLMFVNLHGSDSTRYWYGQEGMSYPEAFEPSVLDGRNGSYVVGVEACYGARYLGGLAPDESILLMAMQNGCLAFLGSSRIAFGTSQPVGSCADIVIGEYIRHITSGATAGDAHHEGLKQLTVHPEKIDDSDIKTLAEFALYGDPSVRLTCGGSHVHAAPVGKVVCHVAKGLPVPMPDVRYAVTMALSQVNAKIEAAIDEYAAGNLLPELREIGIGAAEQKVFRMSNTGLNQKMYSLASGPVQSVAKVYFDDDGRIRKAVVSK